MYAFVRVGLCTLTISAVLIALAAPAAAAPPDVKPDDKFEVITFDGEKTIPAGEGCSFDVAQYFEGFLKLHFTSNQGNGTVLMGSSHIWLLWLNPANGKTSDVTIAETGKLVENDDGSVTFTFAGLTGRDTIPGAGIVAGDIGRIVLIFPAGGGEPTIDFIAGQHSFGPFPGLCEHLA